MLFEYQKAGVDFLVRRKKALLADEPGLGKTRQAMEAAVRDDARHILVICPASVIPVWKAEAARYVIPLVRYDKSLTAVSYDAARSKPELYRGNDTVIIDEAHYLKSPTAKRTKAILGPKCDGVGGIIEGAERVYVLTGTPAPNHAAEMWTWLRAVMPGAIEKDGKPLPYWQFINRFCTTRDDGFGVKITGSKNHAKLREQLAPFMLRRLKSDVLKDLPAITFGELPLAADGLRTPPELADQFAAIERALQQEDPVKALEREAAHVAKLRRYIGVLKAGALLDWINDWFEAGGGKLVVFGHHKDVLEVLRKSEVWSVGIDGSTSPRDRAYAVTQFQEDPDCKLFVGQITAAGTGITLTASSNLVFAETSWVPAENEQAMMRVHRIGQTAPVLVRTAYLSGSLDERIMAACARKMRDIRQIFD